MYQTVIDDLSKKAIKVTAKSESKSRRGTVQYETNPFVSNAVLDMKMKRITNKNGDMMVIGREHGELVAPIAGFWHSEEVDSTKFVKLYINGVKAFKDLTGSGTKVFELLYLKVQENIGKDVIYLSFTEVDQLITPMAESTFFRGMRELISKGFIAESRTTNKYFLNPDYIWNGDRLAFVKEIRRRKPVGEDIGQGNLFNESSPDLALVDAGPVVGASDTAAVQDQSSG